MSNRSHEWTADICLDAQGFTTIRSSDGTLHGDTETQPIATVYDSRNARLIAAAPKLLEALRLMLNTPAMNADDMDPIECRACERARDAIARAGHFPGSESGGNH